MAVLTPVSSSGPPARDRRLLGQIGEEFGAADQQPADGLGDEPRAVERTDLLGQGAPTRAPMGLPASGISLPMLYRITLGWLRSLRTMASTSASHHSGNRSA